VKKIQLLFSRELFPSVGLLQKRALSLIVVPGSGVSDDVLTVPWNDWLILFPWSVEMISVSEEMIFVPVDFVGSV